MGSRLAANAALHPQFRAPAPEQNGLQKWREKTLADRFTDLLVSILLLLCGTSKRVCCAGGTRALERRYDGKTPSSPVGPKGIRCLLSVYG